MVRCRGRENFSDHCTYNSPSKAVWTEIICVGLIIFGLFFCYVRWAKKRKEIGWIEWNDDDSDTEYDTGRPKEQPYYHMHPDLNKKRRSTRRSANSWLSKISSKSLNAELSALGLSGRNVAAASAAASDQDNNHSSVVKQEPGNDTTTSDQVTGESSGEPGLPANAKAEAVDPNDGFVLV